MTLLIVATAGLGQALVIAWRCQAPLVQRFQQGREEGEKGGKRERERYVTQGETSMVQLWNLVGRFQRSGFGSRSATMFHFGAWLPFWPEPESCADHDSSSG